MADASVTAWLTALGYGPYGQSLVTDVKEVGRQPYAAEIRDLLDPLGNFRLDAVFLVDGTPTICFVREEVAPTKIEVDALRQRLWNQNLTSALLVLGPGELVAHPIPKFRGGDPDDRLPHREARPDGNWSAAEVQSSEVQKRLSEWFDPNRRVDRDLLRQLSAAVSLLTSGDRPPIASQLEAQMLLAQVLFIAYLEHRGIVGEGYRRKHRLKSLHQALRDRDGASVSHLIGHLKEDFNGDFLEPEEITWELLDDVALSVVDQLLSRVDLTTGQRDFWNYDFSQIPVELLSGIYETFLQSSQKVDGAYYTPRVLAELAVEEAFSDLPDPSILKVYDGACGSGILLTTAYRKILSYLESTNQRRLNISERIEVLRNSIFGGDINHIACRVTAFSLYLSLLERLSPPDLATLQRDHACKLPKLLGINIADGTDDGDFFSPKNQLANAAKFDVVISNPPWRELKEDEGSAAKLWAAKNRVRMPHRQIAAAFAAKMTDAAKPEARIVVILPSSLITAPTNADFLRQYSVRVSIEKIINLADFRRLLFSQAEHACSIVSASNKTAVRDDRIQGDFEYWAPKVDISFAFNRLTLHEYDRVILPRGALIDGTAVLRRRFWGSRRDEGFLNKLRRLPPMKDAAVRLGWVVGKGYHMIDGGKRADPAILAAYRYLPTAALNSPNPLVDLSLLRALPADRGIASHGRLELYSGPRVLWPDGTSPEIEIRAAYAEAPFCFSSAVGGLRLSTAEHGLAKFITCYLRSSLAKYWLILTGYSASAERARVTVKEIMSLPFVEPCAHADPERASQLIEAAERHLRAFEERNQSVLADGSWDYVRHDIDELIFEYFDVARRERALVRDMADIVAKSLQPTSYAELRTPLQEVVTEDQYKPYLSSLEDALMAWSSARRGQGTIAAAVMDRSKSQFPLDVVHVALRSSGGTDLSSSHARTMGEFLEALSNRIFEGRAIDFFSFPNSIFVWGDDVYVVKPSRRRFWTESAALRDADEIFHMVSKAASQAVAA